MAIALAALFARSASADAAAGDGPAGVRMLSASSGAVRFEVSVPAVVLSTRAAAAGADATVRPGIAGYDDDPDRRFPGGPVRIVVVAVPPLGPVSIAATGAESEVLEGVTLDRADAGDGTTGTRARLIEVGWMRNQRIARIAVFPVDADRGARRLTIWHRIEVDVTVQPPPELGIPAEEPDPMESVYRAALVNYDQGRAWRRPSMRGANAASRALRALGPAALQGLAATVPDSSVYVGRTWIKITIQRTGFYRLDFGTLRKWMGAARMDSLRLFNWPGVPVLPTTSYCDSCDMREVAILTADAKQDSMFSDNDDQFFFYALGPSDWASLYDPARPETVFVDHPYDYNNYYYLTVATEDRPVGGTPARMAQVSGQVTHPEWPVPASFPARRHYEQDFEFWPNASPFNTDTDHALFWEKWFWRSLAKGSQFQFPVSLPAADTTQPVRLRALTWGLDENSTTGTLPDHLVDLAFNDIRFPRRGFNLMRAQVFDSTFHGLRAAGTNVFSLSIPFLTDERGGDRTDTSGLAWFDLFYQSRYLPGAGGRLDFDTPAGGNGDVRYRIGPYPEGTAKPFVFEVSDPLRPAEVLVDTMERDSAGLWLGFQAQETSRRRYRVTSLDSVLLVPSANLRPAPAMSLENLRSPGERADYILLYYDGFQAAAESLATWRRTRLTLAGAEAPYECKAVPVSALYDQFSGGRTDPGAIRNFLRAAFYNWNDHGTPRRPTYVTFFGDASPDYKNILGHAEADQPGCLLPTYEDNLDIGLGRQYTTDDWMLNVDNAVSVIPDFLGGRMPLMTVAEAMNVVRAKVLLHERTAPLGEWRDNVMLIADDYMQNTIPDPLRLEHLRQTVVLDTLSTPASFDRRYIYLHTYPEGNKRSANVDIRRDLDEGSAMMNYVGHGSPVQITDENILLDTDVGSLYNSPRFPVFVSASCDVGKFSDYSRRSLGEQLFTHAEGGCISVVSATELAISQVNAQLNRTIYRELFRRDTTDCEYHTPVSAALLAAKTGSVNGQKYQVMGDAASRPAIPRLWVDVALADSAGNPVSAIQQGQTLSFSGRVLDCPGGTPVPFSGVASLRIEDSQAIERAIMNVVYRGVTYQDAASYYSNGGAVYRGDVSVTNGIFHGRFVVPVEAREGTRGRARAYVEGEALGEAYRSDGAGSIKTEVRAGLAPAGDASGPRISLAFVGGSTSVRPDATLQVDLYDANGILTTGHTPQNGIIVTIDGNTTSRADITESFRYAADSYQSGTAHFQLPHLSLGAHSVSVSAADNLAAGLAAAAHRSRASLDFTVIDQPDLRITHAYLFPNPTESAWGRGGGQFVVDCPGDSVNVLLRIYTVTGRLIRTLKMFGGLGQVQVPWDGMDDEGHPLANGVYLFRVHVNPRDPDGTSSPREKAAADGRFVIVNRE